MNEKIQHWDRTLEAWGQKYGMAGFAVALSDREKTIWQKGYGVTSTEKPWDQVTPQTLFRIASCTKLTLGFLTLIMVERGLLNLDTPVKTYLPWLTMKDESTLPSITLRRLLSHSAGLPSEFTPEGPLEESMLQSVIAEGFAQLRPLAHPEDRAFYYSNWSIRLVSCILEAVGGKSFTALVKEEILEPLGMDHSTFHLQEAATFSLAIPHQVGPSPLHRFPINATRHAAGGLFSSVEDMVKLGRVLLNKGAPLLRPESLEEMMRPQCNLFLPPYQRYGLTMRIKACESVLMYGHDGQSPPFYASIWALPEEGYTLSVTLNTEGGDPLSTQMIPALIFSTLVTSLTPPHPVDSWNVKKTSFSSAVGTYLGDRQGIFTLELQENTLFLSLQGKRYKLTPEPENGIFSYQEEAPQEAVGLADPDGGLVYVGIPCASGGSDQHIYLNGGICQEQWCSDWDTRG